MASRKESEAIDRHNAAVIGFKRERDQLRKVLSDLVGKIEVMGGCNSFDFEGSTCWPEFERAGEILSRIK